MIKTEEIIIKGHRGSKKTFCDIFLYEPENIEEASLGNLYIVAELGMEKEFSQLVTLLNSLIKREYYSVPHRGPLESLEYSLKKANQILNEFADQGNLEWLGKLHFICAALNKEEDLFLSQTGSAQALLCREGEIASITRKPNPAEKIHPAKTFQNVITGKLGPHDKVIFSTPSLFENFPPETIAELLKLPRIETISEHIQKTLYEQKKQSAAGALLLQLIPEAAEANPGNHITPPISLTEIMK